MSDEKPNYRAVVEARILEEAAGVPAEEAAGDEKLPIAFVLSCLRHNRVGDATLYTALLGGQFVFVAIWGRWLKWQVNHWAEDINNSRAKAAVERVCEEYQRIFEECDEAKNSESDLAKLVRKRLNVLRDKSGRENVLEVASTLDDPLSIDGTELDKQMYLIACPNAMVDVRTGVGSPGLPEQYMLKCSPTCWPESGLETEATEFMKFLRSSFDDDEEMVAYILRLLGYGLMGSRDEHIWVVFHGPRGRNGKDTLMKVLFKVLGDHLVVKAPTAMIMKQSFQRSGSQPEPDIIALRGAKFAFLNEGEVGQ